MLIRNALFVRLMAQIDRRAVSINLLEFRDKKDVNNDWGIKNIDC